MPTPSEYQRGYLTTIRAAGIKTADTRENMYSTGGAVGGIAAGSALGGQLAENLAHKTRKEFLGVPIPRTESFDPATARTIGSVIGGLGGGYLGHVSGGASGREADTSQLMQTLPPYLT